MSSSSHRRVRDLSVRAQIVALAIAFVVFLIVDNPLVGDPFDIDGSILWSYAVIPPIVLLFLKLEKKVSLASFALATMSVSLYKFALTITLASVLWLMAPERSHRTEDEPAPTASSAFERPDLSGLRRWSLPGDKATLELSVGERVVLSSSDGRLHTVQAVRGRRQLWNRPVLPDTPTVLSVAEETEEVQLSCTVHGAAEHFPRLRVVAAASPSGAQ